MSKINTGMKERIKKKLDNPVPTKPMCITEAVEFLLEFTDRVMTRDSVTLVYFDEWGQACQKIRMEDEDIRDHNTMTKMSPQFRTKQFYDELGPYVFMDEDFKSKEWKIEETY